MKNIRDAGVILGLLEDGDLIADLTKEIEEGKRKTREIAGGKGSGRFSVTLKLNFDMEGSSCEIKAEVSSVVPKAQRGKSFLFVTEDGFSTDHPRQMSIEDVTERKFGRGD
jgi:hypothetical protein